MKDKYPNAYKLWPEVEWIKDPVLREKTLQVWEYALEQSPLTPQDLEEIPFTLLVKDCKVSFMTHKRAVVYVSVESAKEMQKHFKDQLPIDMDVLISAAILVDVGKLLEYAREPDGKLGKSDMGHLVRHTFSGAGIAMKFDLPPRVVHAIAYHSKEGDQGKRTPEGYILHHVDFMTFEPFKDQLW
ncbi:MAG: HDIG domain-containing protein [Candidatus Thermoplasmatota archaeon]|nr:HDIG domain-containing protein [Candidatus Thermoplasmatota archaeon]